MLFATYQSADIVEKLGEGGKIEPYSIWAIPVSNLSDFFLSSFCCAPNRMEALIFFESDNYLRVDKIKWYQAINEDHPRKKHDPRNYLSDDVDDLHSEFLIETITPEQILMLVPLALVGDEQNILERPGLPQDPRVEAYLYGLSIELIAKFPTLIEANMALGMSRQYAEYRSVMQPKKAAFEMVYLPLAYHYLTAVPGETVTLNVRYMANMISYNADRLLRLNDRFTAWSFNDCSLEGFDMLIDEMRHCIIDNEEVVERLATGSGIGRNELCPCGSGKKYKKCHGFWID